MEVENVKLKFSIVMAAFFITVCAYAGGPFVVDSVSDSGVAEQWKDKTLEWYSEDGDLSTAVNNTTAKQWIAAAISKWTTDLTLQDSSRNFVATADVQTSYMGSVDKDIDATNYEEYVSAQEGETVVVFDKDGAITASLVGEANYKYIPGLSEILLSDSGGTQILKGVVILNGVLLTEGTLTNEEFQSAIQHEIGHLFNMDHTQVNLDIANGCDLGGSCPDGQFIPTMFPELKTAQQALLKTDDKVTLSWIYPNSTLTGSFCMITGEIQDKDSRPLQGVNVIARRVGDGDTLTKDDARSMVSGVLYPACAGDGHYYLYGIVPGKTYEVFYEELSPEYTGMSGFEPLDSPPSDFETATIPASDGATTVMCTSGGQTIEMQAVQVPVTNPCPSTDDKTDTTTKSGGCSLIPETISSPL